MGIFNLVTRAAGAISKGCYVAKYGKLIGVNKKNIECYEKVLKNGQKQYSLFDISTGTRVPAGSKIVNNCGGGNLDTYTFDARGNLTRNVTFSRKRLSCTVPNNEFAYSTRTIVGDYNKMGQCVHRSDVIFEPSISKPLATVESRIDGKISKTYCNTLNGEKYTIHCVS